MATGRRAAEDQPPRPSATDPEYLDLLRRFPPRPIRSAEQFREVEAALGALVRKPARSPAEEDFLGVLAALAAHYQAKQDQPSPLSDRDMLQFLMEDARGLTQAELARATGIPRSLISEVLAGRRGLSRANVFTLAGYFHVSPGVFGGPAKRGQTGGE